MILRWLLLLSSAMRELAAGGNEEGRLRGGDSTDGDGRKNVRRRNMDERGRTERAGGPGGAGPGVRARVSRESRYIALPSISYFGYPWCRGFDARGRAVTRDDARRTSRPGTTRGELRGGRLRRAAFDF